MMKFLHIGDVHLDTTFLCRTETLRARLRDGLRTAFGRAVDCAVSEQVDAFLIAGDLFDNDNLSFRTEELLIDELKRLDANGITTVYVSGNHDPGNGRFAAIASHVAERFHYAPDGNVVVVDVPGRNGVAVGRIVGAGHATAREANNLAKRFPAATSGLPHVGLLHTMVAGARDAEGHDRYAPCAVEDLRKPGYRYWALGHIHVRQQVCDQSHAYYSGNVQGRNPRETGPKGGLLVTIRDGMNPEVAFRSFAPIQWLRLTVKDLSAVATVQELVSRIRTAWDAERAAQDGLASTPSDYVLRLMLEGPTHLYDRLDNDENIRHLEEGLLDQLGALDVEVRVRNVSRPIDLSEHRGQPHLLGEVLKMLDEARVDTELLRALVPDPLAGFRGRGDDERLAYARDLLDGLDREAAMRLLKPDQS